MCMLAILGLGAAFVQAAAGHILYLALRLESSSFPRPLAPGEERAAFEALRAGDTAARDRLIRHNLRLVAHVAKKYYAAPGAQDDMISIGTIGLIKAVDTFDPDRRIRFSSYASQCIENEMRMALRHRRREPLTVSLQDPLESSAADGGALTLADVLPDEAVMEDTCEQRDALARLRRLVDALPARERQVVTLRYGLGGRPPLTQQQVAARLNISRSYISRIEKRALDTLKARWPQN